VAKVDSRGCVVTARHFESLLRFQPKPRETDFNIIGQGSISGQLELKVEISIAVSICIGVVCGGVRAAGYWEAAIGVDMGLTTSGDMGMPGRGLDADGVGCREYTFESKLTNYAEYPKSDGVSILVPPWNTHMAGAPQSRPERP
jgi:hypothetical protein